MDLKIWELLGLSFETGFNYKTTMLTTLFKKHKYWCLDFTDCTLCEYLEKSGCSIDLVIIDLLIRTLDRTTIFLFFSKKSYLISIHEYSSNFCLTCANWKVKVWSTFLAWPLNTLCEAKFLMLFLLTLAQIFFREFEDYLK